MFSGPVAFLHFTFCIALCVEAVSIVNSAGSGSSMSITRVVGSSLGRSALTDTKKSFIECADDRSRPNWDFSCEKRYLIGSCTGWASARGPGRPQPMGRGGASMIFCGPGGVISFLRLFRQRLFSTFSKFLIWRVWVMG